MLGEKIKEAFKIIDFSDEDLVKDMAKVNRQIVASLKKYLKKFTIKNGEFSDPEGDRKLLLGIGKAIRDAIASSDIKIVTASFSKQFEKLTKLITESVSLANDLKIVADADITAEQKRRVKEIIEGLSSPNLLVSTIASPLRGILYRNIRSGISFSQAEAILEGFFVRQGILTKNVKQVTRDALSQWDGYVNQELSEKYNLDGFQIIGSLLVEPDSNPTVYRSRSNCVDMVLGVNKLEPFHLGNGIYRKSDLPAIFKIIEGRDGWIDGTTIKNYYIYRNGNNCRHRILPIRLTKKLIERALKNKFSQTRTANVA